MMLEVNTPEVGTLAECGKRTEILNDLSAYYRIIGRANEEPDGPVRTVTRKEIVPGVYGVVDLAGVDAGQVQIRLKNTGVLKSWFDASELRAAIAIMTEIADALDE